MYAFFVCSSPTASCPHQWLDHADRQPAWHSDKIVFGHGASSRRRRRRLAPVHAHYQALRDIIVVVIYVVLLRRSSSVIWVWWQNRGKKPAAGTEIETSTYGRPLVRKG